MVTTAEKVKKYIVNNVTNADIKTEEHSSWRVI